MDDDPVRRGGPSAHAALTKAFGDAHQGACSAMLASDSTWGLAVRTLARARTKPERRLRAMEVFCAVHQDVVCGQQLDTLGRSKDVESMHALKTGSYTARGPLLVAAALAVARSAWRPPSRGTPRPSAWPSSSGTICSAPSRARPRRASARAAISARASARPSSPRPRPASTPTGARRFREGARERGRDRRRGPRGHPRPRAMRRAHRGGRLPPAPSAPRPAPSKALPVSDRSRTLFSGVALALLPREAPWTRPASPSPSPTQRPTRAAR